jgi:hypothetical protein
VLAARLAESPTEIVSLREQQQLAGAHERQQVCDAQRQLARKHPQDGDLQYLAARCEPDDAERDKAFLATYERHPGSGWVAFAAARTFGEQGNLQGASQAYVTCLKISALADHCAMELARVRRLQHGADAELKDLLGRSESLRMAHMLESGAGMDKADAAQVYATLARGRLAQAAEAAGKANSGGARVLRLVAASDGAPAAVVQQALALDAATGVDRGTVWSAIGLALRHGKDVEPLLSKLRELSGSNDMESMLRFIEVLRTTRDVAQAEAAMAALPVALRAHGFVLGVLALGAQAPANWREYAKRALFVGERPYFS